ncbi:hypothetical protein GALMADRAFT_300478 [Galerina marginata CBS 339.88]|uniref:F-box domain-containing protein n=1 Tax=Galerina marginata (strain CBS 339.88) TaxID=685588 RepID=A0A067U0R1_GALM3|nr:hypothetical protein GALMADRAFT_300478 [Galerina marginata CBS 339.88]
MSKIVPSKIEHGQKYKDFTFGPPKQLSPEQISEPISYARKPYLHYLPDDILLEIFLIYNSSLDRWQPPTQYNLIMVCRRWRDVVLHAPLLWTTICVQHHSPIFIDKYFERSQPALIDVQVDCIPSWSRTELGLTSLISNAIANHSSRLRSLAIRVWESEELYPIFRQWKDHDTINLESLDISSVSSYSSFPSFSSPTFTDFSLWKGAKFLQFLKLEGFNFEGFPPVPNLVTLEVDGLNTSAKEFQALINNSPLLSTLIIRHFETPPHSSESDELQRQIEAPSLRSLAINISNNHTAECGCFLSCLSMKNLEYLEVAYLWNTLTSHHTSIISQWKNLPGLRRLRIHSASLWEHDVSYLSSLPATTNLEIVDFPKTAEPSLASILNLSNLKSVTFDLSSPRVPERSLDAEVFSDVVRRRCPKVGCPIIFRLPSTVTGVPAWLELQAMMGNNFIILSSPTEKGFLDGHLNSQVFEGEDEHIIDGLWAVGSDEEDGENGFEEYDEFDYDYDHDEIEDLREDDIFEDYNDDEFEYENASTDS